MALEDRSFSSVMAITVIGARKQWTQALRLVGIHSHPGLVPSSTYDLRHMVGVTIYPILYWRTRSVTNAETRIGTASPIATVRPGFEETLTALVSILDPPRATEAVVE
jgi:hypothetical protein